ncbi:hypothetical protein ACVIHI_003406 [Bradyrhizobium sp. USDA 4524]|uniref:hypothetical protein n=1 Tax=unclassified Bradyrhizobium TaxID=2631580 RepID=UPI00209CCFE8|nr:MULTISPECIES: hypothetical protein [unclassified Bradyrhizobium]MCP1843675.1 hypothetical protein [Bradyrhizobium sp. USDA 4538]MCP1904241.1 hypothetical protein [Bradyrhizobium sp. USDA 4537]MCP1990103.1 hypothetical protein [Bradyrhizobium sp. USDA 4539]
MESHLDVLRITLKMSDAFQNLIDSDPEWRRRYELIRRLGDESERGMAVLVGAELDRALGLVLCAYLPPGRARKALFSGGAAPLGSFASKIDLCRVLHLISEGEYAALHVIRKIRNEFAHDPDASFASQKIRSWIDMVDLGADRSGDHKLRFESDAASLIAILEVEAVDQAHGRVYEESYSGWYRRGGWTEPFDSKEKAAAARATTEP